MFMEIDPRLRLTHHMFCLALCPYKRDTPGKMESAPESHISGVDSENNHVRVANLGAVKTLPTKAVLF